MAAFRTVYTPSELNREVKLHIEAGFPRIWIEGEISNLSRPASGHLYFTLKDDRAQVRCALFRSQAIRLGFRPENGQQVQVRGRLSLYEARGEYQLIADSMEEAGEGRLRAAFEALKKRLEQEGLFATEAKQPLPRFPVRIAVITSASGAVIRDIINVLRRRWPLAAVRLYPVPVQGDEAPPAIVRAIASANRHAWAEAIIVGRGGGSLEDLMAFNDEAVARAVFASGIPVVSAVGHETDFSITDFVADLRAPTPSAAAELLTPDAAMLANSFQAAEQQLARRMQSCLERLAQKHDHLSHRLSRQHPGYRLTEINRTLAQHAARLSAAGLRLVPARAALLRQYSARLQTFGSRLLPQKQETLARTRERLQQAGKSLLTKRRQRLQELARTLHAVSPLPTLNRGYALVSHRADGAVISSVSQIKAGDHISVQLRDGRIRSTVDAVSDEKLMDGEN